MKDWLGRVTVMPKPSVNDPQGLAVLDGLHSLGYADVERVRVGKHIDVTLHAESAEQARERLQRMAETLLANTLIESFALEVTEDQR